MNNKVNQLYVITGGPGAGKTTLLEELGRSGFAVVPEEARKIIKEQMSSGGDGLPWKNKGNYADLMLNASAETYQQIKKMNIPGAIFFDRGILDTICYMEMEKIPVSEASEAVIRETVYNDPVFILPPWKEIYENDQERKQTWEEAVFTFEKMKETYLKYGCIVIEVPRDTVENRRDFVLSRILP
ncbi:MAG: AAA family ATPase [Chryseobacterium sp.]|jgi:predicted ATPase|uniref:AAA family ATPase n=1 Tax=Chryseobacterium sp. TaxID=1871047 RepID=UPI0028386A7E|nr:AAA family ATPase [Chryseobacterium sp.]MDR2235219.1 AAA family ATPase [Chryseobacterium sp.]